jgi:hypothetical protein
MAAILPDAANKRTARVSCVGRRDPHEPNNRPQIASLLFYRAGGAKLFGNRRLPRCKQGPESGHGEEGRLLLPGHIRR